MSRRPRRIGTLAVAMAAAGVVGLPAAASAAPDAATGSAGAEYAFAPSYTARAWGANTAGQLGNGSTTSSLVPVPVTEVTGLDDARTIVGGNDSAYAVRGDGTVWAWGLNDAGQLGNGTQINSTVPVQVAGLTGIRAIAASTSALGVSGVGYALRNDGTVWAWGLNDAGQLGNGTQINSTVPVQVIGLTGIRAITADRGSAYALRRDGTVWAWGDNTYGQLGTGAGPTSLLPVQVTGLSSIRAVAARSGSAYALRSDGTVWAWGLNNLGQLGNGLTGTNSLFPVPVSGLTSVRSIAAGLGTGYALRSDGSVWAWGVNDAGQLGIGVAGLNSPVPVPVTGATGLIDAVSIAAGDSTAYAVRWDGAAFAWGEGSLGQLGIGLAVDSALPLPVPGVADAQAVAGGRTSGYAIVGDWF
ncbi:RCC1 domain-containing protein [Parafrankia sp. FMc2]|uniref:RCC1 domain-containing protein n=1 Tax=Parafrankia sp. FMc2 TaxID=3233196 RepID=UPI0034D767C4